MRADALSVVMGRIAMTGLISEVDESSMVRGIGVGDIMYSVLFVFVIPET